LGKYAFVVLFLALVLLGAAFRLPSLGLRPFHGDEANQAVKAAHLYEGKGYAYDPHEHHGPTLYYFALPALCLGGATGLADSTEPMYRIVPVLFGLATLLLLWPLAGGLGRGAALWAAAFGAVSHGLVFYDRYFIQEALFVFFSFAAIACAWAYLQRPGWLPALLLGLCLGLMHATKETCVVVFAAMAGAFLFAWIGGRLRGETFGVVLHPRHAIAAIAVAGAVSVLFFTSFFTHPRGPLDSILTYFTYTSRAEGAGSTAMHEQPWCYYLQSLLYVYREAGPRWSEAPVVLLALLGSGVAFLGNPPGDRRLWRFLAAYTLLLTLAFSLVPYKTPWNLLIFLHGMTVLAGLGAAWLVGLRRPLWLRAVLGILLLAALAHGARQSYQGNYFYPADARNPYVYAHTSTALMRLVKRVDDLAAVHPAGRSLQVNVLKPDGDYWPLPWYLRRYDRVGYWTTPPAQPDAPILIAGPEVEGYLKEHLRGEYQQEFHGLRPGALLQMYIGKPLWNTFIEGRK
jgi:uncharacterized protein (TIGR03663 family)